MFECIRHTIPKACYCKQISPVDLCKMHCAFPFRCKMLSEKDSINTSRAATIPANEWSAEHRSASFEIQTASRLRSAAFRYRSSLAASRCDKIFCDGTNPEMNSRRNSANVPAAIAVRTSAISFTYMCEL